MAINKVVYGVSVLVDLTADTVTAATLATGKTAHDASGAAITGTMSNVPSDLFGNYRFIYDENTERLYLEYFGD